MQYTVRAKIKDVSFDSVLNQMGEHLSKSRRKFFVQYGILGRSITELKREFISQQGITARQLNSIASEVKALVSAQKELKKEFILKTLKRIKKLKESIAKSKSPFEIHQFKRRLGILTQKLALYQGQLKVPSVCFGSKSLFQKQFHLSKKNKSSHAAWYLEWKNARDGHFHLIGSKDESFGNQSCQLMPGHLKLRLTHALAKQLGYEWIEIPIQFTYEQDRIHLALSQKKALNYQFLKKENGFWYVHLTFEVEPTESVTDAKFGAIGIDLNPACLAVTQIDPCGNLNCSWQVPVQLRGKTSEQIQAIWGDEIARLVATAKKEQLPIVIEELDFEAKKLQLRSRHMNRMLSQFSYAKFNSMITARCLLGGVTLIHVNPAYTSVIGQIKFSYGYGLSTHMGASMAIARRGLGFGERLRVKSKHRLQLPGRNRLKHSWTDWRKLNPRVFPEEYLFREDRQRPERNQGEQSSRQPASGLSRTQQGSVSEVMIH